MSFSSKDVDLLSKLARIELSPQELDRLSGELSKILQHVEQLKKLNVEGVPPTSHPLKLSNVFREDIQKPSLPMEKALENAPDKEGPFFRVPKIIDSG